MQIWAESGKSALPICNYSQILYQSLAFTQNLNLFHFLLKKYCIKAPINNPTEEITKYQMECMSAESL